MSKAYFKPQNDIRESNQPFRFSFLNSTGSATSYAANQVFTTTAKRSYKNQFLLPVCNVSEPGIYSGTAMVFNNLEICNGRLIASLTTKTVIQSDDSRKSWEVRGGVYCQKVSTGVSVLSISMFWNCYPSN